MSIYLFHRLTDDQKLSILEKYGVEVDTRTTENQNIKLFQVDAFYVELYFDTKTGKLLKLVPFTNTNNLDPYLKNINLQVLLQDI